MRDGPFGAVMSIVTLFLGTGLLDPRTARVTRDGIFGSTTAGIAREQAWDCAVGHNPVMGAHMTGIDLTLSGRSAGPVPF